MEAGKLNTPIWEFEGGKAAHKGSGFLYPYTVSADGKTLTINYEADTVYTYTISTDKEDLFAGKKKVGDAQPVDAENSLLTRNLAGRTYKNLTGEGDELTFTIKTGWSFDGKKGNLDLGGEGKPYEINEAGIISFPYGSFGHATYTLSVDKTQLIPTDDCGYGYNYVLTLVTADEKPVTPPQVNSALNGLGYVEAGKLSTPIWEFEGGKAAHNGSDFLYPYTVSADGKTLTIICANSTVYTYTISADKEGLSDGKKTVGDAELAAENPLLTRNLAGRTYKNMTGEGDELYFTVKTAWTFDGERVGAGSPWENETYEIDEPNIIRFIITKSLKGEYTVSDDKKTLTPTADCSSSYKYVLTLVDDVAKPAAE
ncbi:MAG TPA: hypothetical protein IAA30_02110 [Candidatus Treponema faecavium]|nr:hypothetical protein [Candidatus Treponema faecavium]